MISANRQLAIVFYISFMRALTHLIGCIGILITLDYLAFDGYCTDICSQVLSQASGQMLFELKQFKTFL
jgi:hypothetical protein